MNAELEVPVAPTRVEQLEQALALAREHIAELNQRHETSERIWLERVMQMQDKIDWLQSQIASKVVRQTKGVK